MIKIGFIRLNFVRYTSNGVKMQIQTNPKSQAPNSKQIQSTKIQNPKRYDLEERTFEFAKRCRDLVKKLPRTTVNIEYGKQLARSSGSQAANYIEANESLSRKDFSHRVKICRKESKESVLWLKLCDISMDSSLIGEQEALCREAVELRKIFNAIVEKSV